MKVMVRFGWYFHSPCPEATSPHDIAMTCDDGSYFLLKRPLFSMDCEPFSKVSFIGGYFRLPGGYCCISRWWFQVLSIFTQTWRNDPIWLICFKWVATPTRCSPTIVYDILLLYTKNITNKVPTAWKITIWKFFSALLSRTLFYTPVHNIVQHGNALVPIGNACNYGCLLFTSPWNQINKRLRIKKSVQYVCCLDWIGWMGE